MTAPRPLHRFELPFWTVIEANRARSLGAQAGMRRKSTLRNDTLMVARSGRKVPPLAEPLVIVQTRHTSGAPDDDGVPGALKNVRDGLAEWIGRDDGHPSLAWLYRRGSAPPGRQFITVEVYLARPLSPQLAAAMLMVEWALVGEPFGWDEVAAKYAGWVNRP